MPLPAGSRRKPDLAQALAQYRKRAPVYDRELQVAEPLRAHALDALQLAPGQTVLDVGCGTGLSFERLRQGVGPAGRVVGIEPCGEMLERARARVRTGGWHNVALVNAPAAQARVTREADAALFLFTHDVLQDGAAIDHVLAHLKPGARVVAAGLQWAPPWLWGTNGLVLMAALYSTTSLDGLHQPWRALADRVPGLSIETLAGGGFYVASGNLPRWHS